MQFNGAKEIVAIIIGAIVVAFVILGFIFNWFQSVQAPSTALDIGGLNTRSAVPADTVVPEQNATDTSAGVAAPTLVTPSRQGATTQLRIFNITADKNQFTPSTVIVNENDIIHINLTAVDKSYDINIPDFGYQKTIPQGETGVVEFQGNLTGKFAYYCSTCGNSATDPNGYIIVVPSASSTSQ